MVSGIFGLMMVLYLLNGLNGVFRSIFKQKVNKENTLKKQMDKAVASKRDHRRTQVMC
jgi:hypothetical protein